MTGAQQAKIDDKIHSFLRDKGRDRLGDQLARWILKPRGHRATEDDGVMHYESLPRSTVK